MRERSAATEALVASQVDFEAGRQPKAAVCRTADGSRKAASTATADASQTRGMKCAAGCPLGESFSRFSRLLTQAAE
jgi:hypothetical protein